jgi:hypothetical protein
MDDERPRCEHGVVFPDEFCAYCLHEKLAKVEYGFDVAREALMKYAETAQQLRTENTRLRAALKAVEWLEEVEGHWCPWCFSWQCDGHAADCGRQHALGLL